MIHRAKFQNFKALKDVEVTFDSRLTVLVGPNGSGKTSVLRGIYWLCQMATHSTHLETASAEVGRAIGETYSGGTEPQLVEVATQIAEGDSGFRFRMYPGTQKPSVERFLGDTIAKTQFFAHPGLKFGPAELIQLDPKRLAASSETEQSPPSLQPDGSGLASLMSYFKNEDETRYTQAVSMLRKIVERVQGVRITRVRVRGNGPMGEQLLFDLPDRKGVPASAMSDGTLYALGLIVKILDPQRPKTLLIDDIDHGFHPKAQLTLVELLHKLLDEIPDLQIIATAHSPYILSGLKWEEVRVTGLRDDGSAVIQPLTKHPNYEKWKESMSPGEFWSHAGEEWVLRVPAGEAIAR